MKFGTGSNAERTQKYGGSKYKMTYVRPYIYLTSPIFNCVTPVSVSLANKYYIHIMYIYLFHPRYLHNDSAKRAELTY